MCVREGKRERERGKWFSSDRRREGMDGEGISDGSPAERKVEIGVKKSGRKVIMMSCKPN